MNSLGWRWNKERPMHKWKRNMSDLCTAFRMKMCPVRWSRTCNDKSSSLRKIMNINIAFSFSSVFIGNVPRLAVDSVDTDFCHLSSPKKKLDASIKMSLQSMLFIAVCSSSSSSQISTRMSSKFDYYSHFVSLLSASLLYSILTHSYHFFSARNTIFTQSASNLAHSSLFSMPYFCDIISLINFNECSNANKTPNPITINVKGKGTFTRNGKKCIRMQARQSTREQNNQVCVWMASETWETETVVLEYHG